MLQEKLSCLGRKMDQLLYQLVPVLPRGCKSLGCWGSYKLP